MDFLKTPRAFAIELLELNGNSAAAGMEELLFALKGKRLPGLSPAWVAETLIEISKLREEGLANA